MNLLLNPDKNSKILQLYHKSSKLILPLAISNYYLKYTEKYNTNIVYKTISITNILNMGIHSYISTSAIITDYIKIKNIKTIARTSSLILHSTSILGFIYKINEINIS